MNTKLTLKLDKTVIENAKKYSLQRKVSLSELVENYFRSLTEYNEEQNYSSVVRELSGIISIDNTDDLKKEYTDYLVEKYK
ncbi:MAG TPA: DUF6364 family protein [Spirochaetota bacterium]|nr:DUF6364 family protein [Spirochaetota bacterium]HPJ34209.1 DUF6364 family protein [Spirochaetota bacterium]